MYRRRRYGVRRTYRRKTTTYRKRRSMRPRRRAMRRFGSSYTRVFRTKRHAYIAGFTIDTNAPLSLFTKEFRLSDLPDYTDWTPLFDRYKITGVKIRYVCSMPPQLVATGATDYSSLQFIGCMCKDYDGGYPSTLNDIRQYPNSKNFDPLKSHSWYLKPAVSTPAFRGGVTNAYMPAWNKWIDLAFPDVPHYGFCLGVGSSASQIPIKVAVNIQVTYYISLAGQR